MAKQIIKSEMTAKRALEILSDTSKFAKHEVIEAYANILTMAEELKDVLKGTDKALLNNIGNDYYEIVTRNNRKVTLDKREVREVSLTKAQKELIYSDPTIFKDYISEQIIPAKVKADILAGKFPDKTFTFKKTIKPNVNVTKIK